MVEIYRIEKGAETWKYKAYDYVRTDAFCVGQSIPIELEFSHDFSPTSSVSINIFLQAHR